MVAYNAQRPAYENINEMSYKPDRGNGDKKITKWGNEKGGKNTYIEQIFRDGKKKSNKISHIELDTWDKDQKNINVHGHGHKMEFRKAERRTILTEHIDEQKKHKFPAPNKYDLPKEDSPRMGKSDKATKQL